MSFIYIYLFVLSTFCICAECITNGTFISIKDAPFYVSLDAFYGHATCGGTIISEHWIVTAAHCIGTYTYGQSPRKVSSGTSLTINGNNHSIKKIIISGDYEEFQLVFPGSHDIALIELATPMTFDEYQQPIPIAFNPPKSGDTLIVIGLGRQGKARPNTQVLKKIEVLVNDQETCKKIVPELTISNAFFCAGNHESSSYRGDSGGPAIIDGKLAGIVAWGYACSDYDPEDEGKPEYYTRVDLFYDWILKHINGNK